MKRTIENIIYNGVYQVFILFLPLMTVPYVSRVLGSENMGINSLVNSIPLLLSSVIMFGMNQFGVREIAQTKSEMVSKVFAELWLIQLIIGVLILVLFSSYFFSPVPFQKYYLLEIPFLIGSILDISWLFIGLGEIKQVVLRNTMIKIIIVSSIFIFVRGNGDLWIYLLINSLTYLANIIFWYRGHKILKNFLNIGYFKFNIKYFKNAAIVALPGLASQLYISFDQTLVGIMAGPTQLSYYALPQQMFRSLITLVGSVSTVLMPKMAELLNKNRLDDVKRLLQKSYRFTLIVSFLITIELISNSTIFVRWFWGDGYNSMKTNLALGSLIIIFVSIGGVFANQFTLSKGLFMSYSVPYYVGAVVSIALNFILVPIFRSLGGTVTIVVTELVVFILRIFVLRNHLDVRYIVQGSQRYAILAIIICVVFSNFHFTLNSDFFSLILNGSLILAIYGVGVLIFEKRKAWLL